MSRARAPASTEFGKWLVAQLEKAGMSFDDFAKLFAPRRHVDDNSAKRYIQKWSTRQNEVPNEAELRYIAEILNCTLEEVRENFPDRPNAAFNWSTLLRSLDELAHESAYDRSLPGEYVCYGLVLGDLTKISVSECEIYPRKRGAPLEFKFKFKEETTVGYREFQAGGVIVLSRPHAFFIGAFQADRKDLFMLVVMLDMPGQEINEMDGLVTVIQTSSPSPPGAERVSFFRKGLGYDHEIGPFSEDQFLPDMREQVKDIKARLYIKDVPAQLIAWLPPGPRARRGQF